MDKRMKRVAFIIQCHTNPDQINLLTDALRKIYDCHIFVHLDRKSEQMRRQLHADHITLLPYEKSVDVRWGDFSQCEATLALIEAVQASEYGFDYVWLISGQDLPIVGAEQAAGFLPDPPVPFIEVMGPGHPVYRQFAKRNDIYYPAALLKKGPVAGIGRRVLKYITGGPRHTWPICRRKLDLTSYFGSSWWCLPYDCVEQMMCFLRHHRELPVYFRNALNSDESFFQVLFMQTSYAGCQRKILTYIDWSEGAPSPRTLTNEQWDALTAGQKTFAMARKFDLAVDKAVCHRVLKELCGIS